MHRSFYNFYKYSNSGSQKINALAVQQSRRYFQNRDYKPMSNFAKGALVVGGITLAYTFAQSDDLFAHSANKEQSLPETKTSGATNRVHLVSQVHMIPHPKKAYKGGEDGIHITF
jgi:hypothetical protein